MWQFPSSVTVQYTLVKLNLHRDNVIYSILSSLLSLLPFSPSSHVKVQERLTREIAEALLKAINPSGVGVVVEAT